VTSQCSQRVKPAPNLSSILTPRKIFSDKWRTLNLPYGAAAMKGILRPNSSWNKKRRRFFPREEDKLWSSLLKKPNCSLRALHHIKKDFQQWLNNRYFDAFPKLGSKLEGMLWGVKNKVCDLREPSRGPNIELSEARSHQPVLGCKKLTYQNLAEQIYWWFMLTHTKGIHSYNWSLLEPLSYKSVRTCSYKSVRISLISHYLSEPRSHCW